MIFQNAWILILVPVVIVLFSYGKVRYRRDTVGVRFSSEDFWSGLPSTIKVRGYKYLFILRMLAVCLFLIGLARPQSPIEESKIQTKGIDIVLAIDVSSSMKAADFKLDGKRVNRLAAVKNVVTDFIKGRKNDRIGIVAFAGRAYTVAPLTLDYGWLLQTLERVQIGIIEDGTAIGSGLSSSLNRLKDTKAKSKVVILLTDGRNNAGTISPLTAAEAAGVLGVKVYTIGAGTKGLAPFPVKDFFGNIVYRPIEIKIDEKVLKEIAHKTGAKYFRATNTQSLREIYDEIDRLEKTAIEEKGYLDYKELFPWFVFPGLLLLLFEIIVSNTILRKIP